MNCRNSRALVILGLEVFAPLLLLSLASSSPTSNSDAYLWQRDGNAAAVTRFAGFSSGRLHVLASDDDPRFVRGDDAVMRALRASQVPVIATVRLQSLHDDAVVKAVAAFAGANVKAVEVDFDCAAGQLATYATWLQATQRTLGALPLAITALPSWLDHVEHVAVFDAASEVVLQVHSVRAPALLDVQAAVTAVKRAQAERPSVRIALPTYAVSLKNGAQLHAVVDDVKAVRAVARHVAWFRFPGASDDAAWDLVTLRSADADRGSSLGSGVAGGIILTTTADDAGVRLLRVANSGDSALPLPCVSLDVAGDGAAYDAHAGFVVDGCAICPSSARFLFGHSDVVVGWARPSAPGEIHAATVTPSAAAGSRHACPR